MRRLEKRWFGVQFLGAVVALGLLSVSLAQIPFYTRGEGREAIAAASVWQGNIILPKGYGEVVASKPPLLHWLIAGLSYFSSYPSEFFCRAPALLFAVGSLSMLLWSYHRLGDVRRGVVVCAMCATMFEWSRSAVSCRVDMIHAATMALALLVWFLSREQAVRGLSWHALGVGLMTLSVLAKGPVAIIIPALVFVAWFFVQERPRERPVLGWGIAAMVWCSLSLIISASWYGLAYRTGGEAFWDRVWYENIARFAGTMEDNPHAHGPLYLIGQLIIGTMPWSLVVVLTFWCHYRGDRNVSGDDVAVPTRIADNSAAAGALSGTNAEPPIKSAGRVSGWYGPVVARMVPRRVSTWWDQLLPLERFSVVVVMVVFCFYEIPRGKRGVYLLPAYPYLAILGAQILLGTTIQGVVQGTIRLIGTITIGGGLFLLLAGFGATLFGVDVSGTGSWFYPLMALLKESLLGSGWFAPTVMVVAVALTVGSMAPPRDLASRNELQICNALNLACAMLGLILFTQGVVQPAIARCWSEKYIAERMEGVVAATDRIVSWKREFYGVSFYLRRSIFRAEPTPKLGEVCILPAEDLDELRKALSPPLQPIPVVLIKRGILPSDTVLVVKIESPGSGLGSV